MRVHEGLGVTPRRATRGHEGLGVTSRKAMRVHECLKVAWGMLCPQGARGDPGDGNEDSPRSWHDPGSTRRFAVYEGLGVTPWRAMRVHEGLRVTCGVTGDALPSRVSG